MDTCLLCLKTATAFSSYIPINSQRWWQCDVLGVIEKHFWPVDDQPNTLGICFLCWSKLYEFHIFYQNIEEAHRRITGIFTQHKANCCMETEMPQTSAPQVGKTNFMPNEETEFGNYIKTEASLNEYEHLLCEPSSSTSYQITLNPISIEKRKRGRPRKQHNIIEKLDNKPKTIEKLDNKPKGKRGRPRKIDIHNESLTKELEISPQSVFVTTVSNGSAAKKNARGRPRKVQKHNENFIRGKEIIQSLVPVSDAISAKESSEEKLTNDKLSNLKETEKSIIEKRKILALLKKRKPQQQHKALMRKYIATSVRCMKFFRK